MTSKKEEQFENVELELDNDTILELSLEAHKQDITLNQLVINIMKDAIERSEGEEDKQ